MTGDPSRYDDARARLGDLHTFLVSSGVQFKGKNFRCIMPAHEDKNPSAGISPDGTRWRCFVCDEWGSVLDAYAIMRGLTIKDAVDDILGKYQFTKPKPKAIKEKAMTYNTNKPPQMEGDDLVFMQDCADNLYASPSDILRIARWRRWSPKTITRLATDRSIGIAPDGRMTFCYMTGVKYRNRDGITPKVIWKKGSRQCLWRVCQMYLANPKTVYITEGETDAITLIDDGLEPEWFNRNEMLSESHTMVVALPCATYTLSWELELFAGVDVVIWGDPDAAGVASMNRNADALTGVARSVRKASA